MYSIIYLLSILSITISLQPKNETALVLRSSSEVSHLRAKRQFGGFGGCCAPIIPPMCCGGGFGIGMGMGIPIPPPIMMGGFGMGMGSCCSCCQPVCMPMCMGRGCGCGGFGFGRKKRSSVLQRNPPALRLTYVPN